MTIKDIVAKTGLPVCVKARNYPIHRLLTYSDRGGIYYITDDGTEGEVFPIDMFDDYYETNDWVKQ